MKAKRWISSVVALCLCAGAIFTPETAASAQPAACDIHTQHGGELTADETWCAANSPHYLIDDMIVPPGFTLTIEPGVTVQGTAGTELKIRGHLSAAGTASQPILFTSYNNSGPVEWAGISIDGGTANFDYVTVRYGGEDSNSVGRGDIAIANVQTGEVTLRNSHLSDVSYSFYLNRVQCLWIINSRVTVENTTFTGCASSGGQYGQNYPIYVSGSSSVATISNNTFTNNYKNRIALEPGAMMGQNATLWPQASGGAYELLDTFEVPSGITLTVQPGVTIMGNLDRELRVLGRLDSLGTAAHPVLFTSVSDSAPEQWSGIYFNGGAGRLQYTTVRYAGGANSGGWRAGLTARDIQTGELVLDNAAITGNLVSYAYTVSHGMVVQNSHVQVSNSLFSNNGKPAGYSGRDYPLYISGADSIAALTGNTFTGNGRDKIGLAPGTFSSSAAVTLTPQASFKGYELDGSYTLQAGHTLSLEAGVTLSGGGTNDELLVQGHLDANGTAAQPVILTSGSDSAWNQWPGVVFDGGTGHLSYVTARYGGIASSQGTNGTLNAIDVPQGGLVIEHSRIEKGFVYGLQAQNSRVTITDTRFHENGADPRSNAAIYALQSSPEITSCIFVGNARDVTLSGAGNALLANNAFLGGWTEAYKDYNNSVILSSGASAALKHNTFANLGGSGVWVKSASSAALTNTIFAQNPYGVTVESGSTASLDHTLWDNNGVNVAGSASETNSVSGPAAFAEDGYHLTRYSTAIGRGAEAGTSQDIDAESRPLPAGTAPDIGADEYILNLGDDLAADMAAFAPTWSVLPDALSGDPSGKLEQKYFLRYFYGSPEANPPALDVAVSNTLPSELAFKAQQSNPGMTFSQQGQTLQWQSTAPLTADRSGEIVLSGSYDQPVAGQVLTNTATLSLGSAAFDLQASAEVPLFSPLITSPGDGEICTGEGNSVELTVKGAAQNSAVIKFYEDSAYVGETTAAQNGLFSFKYTSTRVGASALTLSARACKASDPGQCSDPFNVSLTPQQSFWDPQLSYWEFFTGSGKSVIHRFRKDGLFSTQNSVRPRASEYPSSALHLYVCEAGTELWVTMNNEKYYPSIPDDRKPQAEAGKVIGASYIYLGKALQDPCSQFSIRLAKNGYIKSDSSCALIDPDGTVFDSTRGFDPLNPSQHAVAGATVTCMAYLPYWGGWVPWPAQLYDNQVNPQVTGADGYFAFFTPPGSYYLQVEGGGGYQPWRSEVIEVVADLVHRNIPLTPLSSGSRTIALTAQGPSPAEVAVPPGSTLTWIAEIDGVSLPEAVMALFLDPLARVLSTLDPLANRSGWDSGMLSPGETYTRTFTTPGTYFYSDGKGNTGKVVVEPHHVYLPWVRR